MDRSSIIAHRGLHYSEDEKNSAVAIRRAIEEGFGFETDIRDINRKIVVSHDPPTDDNVLLSFEWLLQEVSSTKCTGRIALNIKSDGLSETISSAILTNGAPVSQFYVFDMSVPDTIPYLRSPIDVYTRQSDYELAPVLLEEAQGVWIDDFSGSNQQVRIAKQFMDKGLRVAVVSSELHKRTHAELWNQIYESEVYLSPLFELCTDLPIEAANHFCNSSH